MKIWRKGRVSEECPSVDEREKPPHPSEQINLSEEKRHLLQLERMRTWMNTNTDYIRGRCQGTEKVPT